MSTQLGHGRDDGRPGGAPAGSAGSEGGADGLPPQVSSTGLAASKAAASVLWVIVGAGLAYGVVQTALKVPALFGA